MFEFIINKIECLRKILRAKAFGSKSPISKLEHGLLLGLNMYFFLWYTWSQKFELNLIAISAKTSYAIGNYYHFKSIRANGFII